MDTPPEDKVVCKSCGQENPATADFCWQCYTPLKTVPRVQTPQQLMPLDPAGVVSGQLDVATDVPFDVRSKRGVTVARAIWVFLFLAVAVGAGLIGSHVWKGSSSAFPGSIGGHPMLTDPTSTTAEHLYETQTGGKGELRFYGDTAGSPVVQLSWFRNPPLAIDSALTQAPFRIPPAEVSSSTLRGIAYHCAPASAAGVGPWLPQQNGQGGVCVWMSRGVGWTLISKDLHQDPIQLAVSISTGAGVGTFVVLGLLAAVGAAAAFFGLRLIWRMFLR